MNTRPDCVCLGTAVQILKRILMPDRSDSAAAVLARGMRFRSGETGIDVRCVCHRAPCVIDEVSLRTASRIKTARPAEESLDPAENVIQEGFHLGMPLDRFRDEMKRDSRSPTLSTQRTPLCDGERSLHSSPGVECLY